MIDQYDEAVQCMLDALEGILEAIDNKGPSPKYHDIVMKRHREEWPRLWERIDEVRNAVKKYEEYYDTMDDLDDWYVEPEVTKVNAIPRKAELEELDWEL